MRSIGHPTGALDENYSLGTRPSKARSAEGLHSVTWRLDGRISQSRDLTPSPEGVDELDRGAGVGDAEALAAEGAVVDLGVELGEALGEFDLDAVDGDGAEGGAAALARLLGDGLATAADKADATPSLEAD